MGGLSFKGSSVASQSPLGFSTKPETRTLHEDRLNLGPKLLRKTQLSPSLQTEEVEPPFSLAGPGYGRSGSHMGLEGGAAEPMADPSHRKLCGAPRDPTSLSSRGPQKAQGTDS